MGVVGCESGPDARPQSVDDMRALRDECARGGVAFFFKQATESADTTRAVYPSAQADRVAVPGPIKLGAGSWRKGKSLIEQPYLDGVQHIAFPTARAT